MRAHHRSGRGCRAVILAAGVTFALAGCKAGKTTVVPDVAGTAGLGRAFATAPANTTAPAATVSGTTGKGAGVDVRGRCGGWRHDPDEPLPACSPIRPLLAAATRFADAYMPYETGQLTNAVRADIDATCTPAFAGFLLSQPVSVPRGQHLAPEQVTSVLFAGGTNANASWVAAGPLGGQSQLGTVQLTLTRDRGRWLVSAAKALL